MALYKEGYTNDCGVKEEYWRLISVNLNLDHKTCDLTFSGYHDQRTRSANMRPMTANKKIRCHWGEEHFNKYFSTKALAESNIYEQAYNFSKNNEFFKDAKDV